MTAIAAGFAAAATWTARRFGGWALLPIWLAGSALAAGAFALRVRQIQAGFGVSNSSIGPFFVFWQFLPLWLFGLGAVTLLLVRRRRRGFLVFDRSVAIHSMGAFLGGALLWVLVYAAWDFTRLF
jgi:hypothetical protein